MADGERDRLGRALGWFSLGLGAAELMAPDGLGRLCGLRPTEGTRGLLRALGAREMLAGVGILGRRRTGGFLWSRVAGDAMDLALLGNALANPGGTTRTAAATAAVACVTVVDVVASARHRTRRPPGEGSDDDNRGKGEMHGRSAVTIQKPRQEVYAYWRDVGHLPAFMFHLASVEVTGETSSHWVANAPLGTTVEWDAEIVEDAPGERIAWRSVDGAMVPNHGVVRFGPAPGDRGTEVHVEVTYSLPGGPVGAAVARLLGEEPGQQISDDLRRLKQVLETGEVVLSEGMPVGVATGRQFPQGGAQPRESEGANA